jgi:hypothetical protein
MCYKIVALFIINFIAYKIVYIFAYTYINVQDVLKRFNFLIRVRENFIRLLL